MAIAARKLSVYLFDTHKGQPMAEGNIRVLLDRRDETADGMVFPDTEIQAYTDENGYAELELWPNILGVTGSRYRVRGYNSVGQKQLDELIVMPDQDTLLNDLILTVPDNTPDLALQLARIRGNLAYQGEFNKADGFPPDASALDIYRAAGSAPLQDATGQEIGAGDFVFYDGETGQWFTLLGGSGGDPEAIGELDTRVSALETLSAALGDRLDLAESRLDQHDTEIQALQDELGSVSDDVGDHTGRLDGLDGQLGNLAGNVGAAEQLANDAKALADQHEGRLDQTETDLSQQAGELSDQANALHAQGQDIAANADDITLIDSRVTEAEGEISATGSALSAVEQTVSRHEGEISSVTSSVDALQGSLANTDSAVSANVNAIDALDVRVTSTEDSITSQASSITTLEARANQADTERDTNATAIGGLQTTVTQQGENIDANASAITDLDTRVGTAESDITGNASAISGLETRVTTNEGEIDSQASDITQLQTDVGTAQDDADANASAISGLDTRVTTAEGDITSNSGAITSLDNRVSDAESDISGNASAISGLDTRVATAEDSITSQASEITQLQTDVGDAQADADQAAQDAADAAGIAEGKGKVLIQSSAPTAAEELAQNLWIDTTDGANTPKRWTGTAWEPVTDQVAVDAADAAAQAQADANANSSAISGLDSRVSQTEQGLNSQASDITQLQTDVSSAQGAADDAQSDANSNSSAITALDSRVAANEDSVSSISSDVTSLDNRVTDVESDVGGNSSAISGLDSRVTANEDGLSSQASDITQLQTDVGNAQSDADQAAQDAADAAGIAEGKGKVLIQSAAPPASEQLSQNLWIDTTNGANTPKRWNGAAWEAVTDQVAVDAADAAAQAQADAAANSSAISGLDSRVTQNEQGLTSQASDITDLQTAVGNAQDDANANAGAISALDTRVTTAEGSISSNASDITDLNTRVTDAESEVSGNADAIGGLQATVSSQGDSIDAQASDISQLQTDVDNAQGDADANASAISGLDSRVTATEDSISSQASDITNLQSTVDSPSVRNYSEDEGVLFVPNPGGAQFSGGGGATGAIKIKLPQWYTKTMLRLRVEVFVYGAAKSFTLECGGYAYASTRWINTFAHIQGGTNNGHPVRFGDDGDTCCIWVGETNTQFPHVKASVRDVLVSYRNNTYDLWGDGWSMEIVGTFDNVTTLISDTLAGSGDTNKVGGRPSGQLLGEVDDALTESSANASAVQSLDTRVTQTEDQVSAQASDLTQLQTDVGDATATVSELSESIDGIEAKYSLTVDANGVVSGIELISGGSQSSMTLRTDQLKVIDPAGTPGQDEITPFSISNGVVSIPDLRVNGGNLADGSVDLGSPVVTGQMQGEQIEGGAIVNISEITASPNQMIFDGNDEDQWKTVAELDVTVLGTGSAMAVQFHFSFDLDQVTEGALQAGPGGPVVEIRLRRGEAPNDYIVWNPDPVMVSGSGRIAMQFAAKVDTGAAPGLQKYSVDLKWSKGYYDAGSLEFDVSYDGSGTASIPSRTVVFNGGYPTTYMGQGWNLYIPTIKSAPEAMSINYMVSATDYILYNDDAPNLNTTDSSKFNTTETLTGVSFYGENPQHKVVGRLDSYWVRSLEYRG